MTANGLEILSEVCSTKTPIQNKELDIDFAFAKYLINEKATTNIEKIPPASFFIDLDIHKAELNKHGKELLYQFLNSILLRKYITIQEAKIEKLCNGNYILYYQNFKIPLRFMTRGFVFTITRHTIQISGYCEIIKNYISLC
jgi:hypothetical protein